MRRYVVARVSAPWASGAVLALCCLSAQAASFQVTATAQAGAQNQRGGVVVAPAPIRNTSNAPTGAATTAGNDANAGQGFASSSSGGYAAAGVLKAWAGADASATYSGSQPVFWGSGGNGSSEAVAQSLDSFSLHAAGIASGARGTLTFSIIMNGGLGGSGVVHGQPTSEEKSQWTANFALSSTLNGGSFGSATWHGGEYRNDADWRTTGYITDLSVDGQPSLGAHQFTIPFAFDQAINLSMVVDVLAAASAGSSCSSVPDGVLCTTNTVTSMADFSHTVLWGGISSVKDANGQVVSQFSALSATSGFDYAASAVPEPGTGALFALGLAAWCSRRRASSRLTGAD